MSVPQIRVRTINEQPVNGSGDYVLYWMVSARRPGWNFSLDRAVQWCDTLAKPLLVFEPLRCDYRWASDRFHRFVLQGMATNAEEFSKHDVAYYPYVEPSVEKGKGLLAELAKKAAVVVTDDYPCFFLPRMLEAARSRIATRFEAVDSNGLLPVRAADRAFSRAFDFRRFLQRVLPEHLAAIPNANPLEKMKSVAGASIPKKLLDRWPRATGEQLTGGVDQLAELPIDHSVGPAAFDGGFVPARRRLSQFVRARLFDYESDRNHPDADATSGLSPYLHFGHVSAHEVFATIAKNEAWRAKHLSSSTGGSREGWWGMSPAAESFLDELVTWRELGFNACQYLPGHDRYDSLPDWAKDSLAKHANDPRPVVYQLDELERAATHDEIWNSAQRQLAREGRMHNYLRMLWGKKILEWSATPQDALDLLIELNNKYAVDGRDPNSYSGIFWILGRYDRAWGPERPIFGKIRYMSSDNTARKLRLKDYLQRYSD
jgi:deoxyribodipyrimidine photo-lyase